MLKMEYTQQVGLSTSEIKKSEKFAWIVCQSKKRTTSDAKGAVECWILVGFSFFFFFKVCEDNLPNQLYSKQEMPGSVNDDPFTPEVRMKGGK